MKVVYLALLCALSLGVSDANEDLQDPSKALMAVLSKSDRLLIRTGGHCHRYPGEKVLSRIRSSKEVQRIARLFELKPRRALLDLPEGIENADDVKVGYPMRCLCCGEVTFVFSRGSEVLLTISVHHWEHVRFLEPAKIGSEYLTPLSSELISKYVGAIPGFKPNG